MSTKSIWESEPTGDIHISPVFGWINRSILFVIPSPFRSNPAFSKDSLSLIWVLELGEGSVEGKGSVETEENNWSVIVVLLKSSFPSRM